MGGCPRSGTTALTRLLNRHSDVLIGNERYYRVIERGELTPAHFEMDRFLSIEPGDTHDEPPGMDEGPNPHWVGVDPGGKVEAARMIGDKYPPIFRAYPMLAERFADAHIVYVLRNPVSVAESYQGRADDVADRWPFDHRRAVDDWNRSVRATAEALADGMRITVVAYETMMAGGAIGALLAALGVGMRFVRPVDDLSETARIVATKVAPRDEAVRQYVCLNADTASYAALMQSAINTAQTGERRAG